MKNLFKVLSAVLIVCMLLGVFAACNTDEPGENSSPASADESQQPVDSGALDTYLLEIDGTTVSKDFTLPNSIGGKEAVWTSDNDAVKLEKRDEDYLASIQFPDNTQEVHLTVESAGAKKTFTIRVNALDVYTFLDNYAFPQDKQTVTANFPLDKSYTYKDRTADIAWSVDEEYADYLAVSEDGSECVVYGSSLNPTVRIKATFTYNGESAPKTFRLTVGLPMNELEKIDNWYNTTGLTQTISGYVVAKGPWTNYNGTYEAILYVIDDSLKAGYYLYNEPTDMDEATYAALEPGMHITCTNPVNSDYNGLMETSNYKGKTTLDADIEPIDITPYALDNDLLGNVPALRYRQSTLVSLTDWKVTSVNAKFAEKSPTTLLTLEKGGVSIAVQITKYFYDYKHEAGDPVVEEILKKVGTVKVGDWISVEGVLGWYKAPQIALLSAEGIKEGKKDSSSDFPGTKVAKLIEKNRKLLTDAGADKLLTANKSFSLIDSEGDVSVKFELCSNSGAVTLDGGNFTVAPGKAEKVHVQATYTCGDYETVTFFYLESVAKDASEKVKEEVEKYTVEDRNAGVSELRTVPLVYEDVVLSFEVADEASKKLVSITKKGAMTLQPVEARTEVTIRVTATCGDQTASGDVKFGILPSVFTAYDVVAKPEEGTEYKLGFDNGVVHLATGEMSGFYGVTSTTAEDGVPAYVEKSGKGYNVYVLIGSKQEKKYVNMTESGDYVNYTYDDKASTAWNIDSKGNMTTTDSAKETVWVGTRGTFETIGAYRDSKYAMNKEDSYVLHLYTVAVDTSSPAERAKKELELISIPSSVTEDLELPTTYKKYYDVTISWSLKTKDTKQRVKNGKLLVERGSEDEEIELTAVAKCGEAKKSKTFTVKVMAVASQKYVSEIYEIGAALDDRQVTDAEYECIGIVSKIATEYSSEFENISVWMTDGNSDKDIEGYRLKGDSAAKLKVGDVITVVGKVQNYGGTVEFVAGSIIKERVPATLKTVTELYENGKSANQDKTTVFSTYGTVDEIVNPISGEYTTMNLFITDGTNRIECYKLGGNVDELKKIEVGDVVACYGTMTTYNETVEFNGCTLISIARVVEKTDAEKAEEELKRYKIEDQNAGAVDLNTKPARYEDVTFSFAVEDETSKKYMSVSGNRLKLENVEKDTEVTLKVTATCGKESVSGDVKFKILVTEFVKYTNVTEPETKTAYKLGYNTGKQYLFATGEMSGFYGATASKSDEGVDAYVEKSGSGWKVYVLVGGKTKKYVNLTVVTNDSGTHYNYTYDDAASTVWSVKEGFKVTVDGEEIWAGSRGTYTTISCYKESAYASTADTSYPLYLLTVEKDDSSPEEHAQTELDLLEIPASITADLDLPDIYQQYYDVELSWAMKEAVEGQTLDGSVLKITRGETDVSVTLVCTATCGSAVKTKEFTVKVEANATVANVNTLFREGNKLDAGAFLDGQYECTAIVSEVATAYSDQYENISVWLVDGPPVRIEAYQLKGEGAADIQVGDVITVVGKVKKYVKNDDVTIEFDQGCTLKSRVPATFKTVSELYADGTSGNQDKKTVFSTYGKVTSVVNGISGNYTTVNVFITDGAEEIECYKLGGDVEALKTIKEGDFVSCYGTMSTYNSTIEFNGCTLVALTGDYELSDAEIAEEEAQGYKLADQHAGELTLPTTPKHEGTTFAFSIEDETTKEYATLADGVLTLVAPDAETTLKLHVTATYKGETASADCSFKLLPTSFTTYQAVETPAVETAYKIGFEKEGLFYLATGAMSGYYGATDKDANKAADAYVESASGGWKLYILNGETKKYINYTISGTFINYTYNDEATTVWSYEDNGYFHVLVDGEDVWAGTRDTYTTIGIYQETVNPAGNNYPLRLYEVAIDNATTEERAQAELDLITLPASVTENLALPTEYQKYYDVVLTWEIKTAVEGQTITDGKTLTITRGDDPVDVVLVCTATCGVEVKTKEFTVQVAGSASKWTVTELYNAGMKLASGKFLDGEYKCTATIDEIDTAYNETYDNISVWLSDGGENRIMAYRLIGGSELQVGDVITVSGKVKRYNNIIEFDAKCTYVKED